MAFSWTQTCISFSEVPAFLLTSSMYDSGVRAKLEMQPCHILAMEL